MNIENNDNNKPDTNKQKPEPLSPRARLLRSLLPALVLTLVVVAIFFLKIWKFDPRYEREAAVAENHLAILDFNNNVNENDPELLGKIIANLLIIDLSESQYMSVVSDQHLYDILKQLGRDSTKKIDRQLAVQAAARANARWVLTGDIMQLQPHMVITGQLIETASGRVVGSLHVTGGENESIFALVDKLTVEIKKALSLPAAALDEPDPAVADVTTKSLEAYRYYLIGVEDIYEYFWTNARFNLSQAIRLDSTFAPAYARLAFIADDDNYQRKMISRAVEYADQVGIDERYYILGLDAYITHDYERAIENFQKLIERNPDNKTAYYYLAIIYRSAMGQNDKAVYYLNKLIEIDPEYRRAYNLLAYTYDALGEFDESIRAIDKYISLVPDEADPYDSRGDIYAFNGQLDEAIASYKKALQIKPDFEITPGKLGNMYLFKQKYAEAESLFQAMASSPERAARSSGRASLADVLVHEGKFKEALDHWNYCIKTDSLELGPGPIIANRIMTRIDIYIRLNSLKTAENEVKRLSDFYTLSHVIKDWVHVVRGYDAWISAAGGDYETADSLLDGIASHIDKKNASQVKLYELIRARVNFLENKFGEARSYYEKTNAAEPSFENLIMIARCLLGEDEISDAAVMFEKALNRYDYSRAYNGILAAKAHYWLGLTYEKLEQNDKAAEQYKKFLELWKDADPGVTEIDNAQKRLTQLKSKS